VICLKEFAECFKNNKLNILIPGQEEHCATYPKINVPVPEQHRNPSIELHTGSSIQQIQNHGSIEI
jgi:hypothetical protein